MLNQLSARNLGLSGPFPFHQLTNISFFKGGPLWHKNKSSSSSIPIIQNLNKSHLPHKYQFRKYGKTLGLETTRFIQYQPGMFYYYQEENDNHCKGYCQLQNLYMYIFIAGNQYAMYLTNGTDYSVFYFNNATFIQNISQSLLKQVVQLNFRDRYKTIDQIGQGTFSKVYLVINRLNNKKYAAKIVPKIDSSGFHTKTIVEEQKKILKYLSNSLVGQMFEFFEQNEYHIFILEFIEGLDLHKYIKQLRQTPLNENIQILIQILKSLQYIHSKNIIHRDLKPHNIVYNTKEKSIKLIDFGLSLIYDENTELRKFMRCGTMGYIAPQIVNNSQANRKRYDTKSDMFGFGVIAHMLLMGNNPIRGKNYKETVEKNIKGEVVLDKKAILVRYGSQCFDFLSNLLQKQAKNRMSAKQALNHKFLEQKYKDEESVLHQQQFMKQKNDQINYIEDKQFLMTNSKVVNLNMTASKFNMQSPDSGNKSNPKIQSIHNLDQSIDSPTKKSGMSWVSTTYQLTNHLS